MDDAQILDLDSLEMVSGGGTAKVRLLQDVPGHGKAGDVIDVEYGRVHRFTFCKLGELAGYDPEKRYLEDQEFHDMFDQWLRDGRPHHPKQ